MKLSDELNSFQNIIDEFYQVFNYPAPTEHLNACDCGGCIDDNIELEMRTLPLRELTKEHFYQYNTAAKDEMENPNEIKYFLPRIVELFVQDKELHHSTELYFERVKNCPKESFSPKEMALWDKFANLYLDIMITIYPDDCFDGTRIENLFSFLLMFNLAHIDIEPFLIRWRSADTPQAVAHYVHSSWVDYWRDDGFDTDVGFWDYSDDFLKIMANWLENPKNKAKYAKQIQSLDKEVLKNIRDCGDYYPDYIEKLLKKMS